MKKIIPFFLVLFCLANLGSCKQKLNVPSAVQEAFEQKFLNTQEASWEYDSENNLWEVEFLVDETELSAVFNADGEWMETEMDIPFSELPQMIQDALNTDYPDYNIEELEWIESPEGVFYEVDFALDNAGEESELEILFASDGSVVLEK